MGVVGMWGQRCGIWGKGTEGNNGDVGELGYGSVQLLGWGERKERGGKREGRRKRETEKRGKRGNLGEMKMGKKRKRGEEKSGGER